MCCSLSAFVLELITFPRLIVHAWMSKLAATFNIVNRPSQSLHLSLLCNTSYYLCSAWWQQLFLTSFVLFFVHRADIPGCIPGGAAGGDTECEHGRLGAGVGPAIFYYCQKSGHHQGQRLPRQRQEGEPVATLMTESRRRQQTLLSHARRHCKNAAPNDLCCMSAWAVKSLFKLSHKRYFDNLWPFHSSRGRRSTLPSKCTWSYESKLWEEYARWPKGGSMDGTHCRSELLRSADQPRRRGHSSSIPSLSDLKCLSSLALIPFSIPSLSMSFKCFCPNAKKSRGS